MRSFQAKPEVRYYAIPALIISLFAYLVAHCVLSIYEVSAHGYHSNQQGRPDLVCRCASDLLLAIVNRQAASD